MAKKRKKNYTKLWLAVVFCAIIALAVMYVFDSVDFKAKADNPATSIEAGFSAGKAS